MKIAGIGIDMVDTTRLKGRAHRRIAEFILVPQEQASMRKSRDELQFLASRLAIKEAVIKAYPERLSYHDICVTKRGVKPQAVVRLKTGRQYHIHVSMAHELQHALAWAIVTA